MIGPHENQQGLCHNRTNIKVVAGSTTYSLWQTLTSTFPIQILGFRKSKHPKKLHEMVRIRYGMAGFYHETAFCKHQNV
jgi:hypothetical protein